MKTKLTLAALTLCLLLSAQKKKNGTMYIEHPAIDVINQMYAAVNAKDSLKLASLIADDFKGFSGDNMNKDAEATTKAAFLQNIANWQTYNRYFSLNHTKNGYPDAVEYKDDTFSNLTWVYAWEKITGIGGTTGVKFSQPRHAQYGVTSDGQIVFLRIYQNQMPFAESWRSQRELKDGQIYSHHPNINTVRKALHAIEFNDMDAFYEAFADNAQFDGLFNDWGNDPLSKADFKALQMEFLESYSVNSFDCVWIKYYEFDSQRNYVQSWWRVSLTRKSDNKVTVIPVLFNHGFNAEGKIFRHNELWNQSKLD
jgi:ketosteroid isomerase-like protein